MLIYADGSALSQALRSDSESASWMQWADAHADQIVTSPLGISELRRAADPLDLVARQKARAVAESVTVLRFFDQSLRSASFASSVLPPFAAIHLGMAVAHPEVGGIATYDQQLARVAALHRLEVITPGRPPGWWM
jgi:predicted nucleic acid-binding protein